MSQLPVSNSYASYGSVNCFHFGGILKEYAFTSWAFDPVTPHSLIWSTMNLDTVTLLNYNLVHAHVGKEQQKLTLIALHSWRTHADQTVEPPVSTHLDSGQGMVQ